MKHYLLLIDGIFYSGFRTEKMAIDFYKEHFFTMETFAKEKELIVTEVLYSGIDFTKEKILKQQKLA